MNNPAFELAELNVARARAPVEDPAMHGFTSRLEEINALAERAPGFVWRLEDEAGNATSFRPFENEHDVLINLSVWESIDALRTFVYQSAHGGLVRDGTRWFHEREAAQIVLWWVPYGYRPSLEEALEKLAQLRRDGPTPDAFDLANRFAHHSSASSG